ncbi:hypothetical protein X975_11952, partial [Stegodyphus mimosarum]
MASPIFSLRTLIKHYELIPITTLFVVDMAGFFGFGAYILCTKPDVTVIKSRGDRYKRIDLDQPQTLKLQKHHYPKEIDDLRKELWGIK